jgi:predicted transcriptional regulator
MTTKQLVIERLGQLPESASLMDFKEELQIMQALQEGREDIAAGRSQCVDEAKAALDTWFTK